MVFDGTRFRKRHCEERSDVAISCGGDSYTIEIAKLPSVAREDGNFWDNLVPLISRLS